ncbi:MAG: hypothetical protein AAGU21_15670 [Solidesulfovibrio sp.]|uniref:hypothetical protein n=1 Tax=Solidesulfovibrio sp. TaxID=2910990 RepID=UPI003159576E
MESSYLFEFESDNRILKALVEIGDDYEFTCEIIDGYPISDEYRRIHGSTPHAYLLANLAPPLRVELAVVVGYDFSVCVKPELNSFLSALINRIDSEMTIRITSVPELVAFVRDNYPD